MNNIDLIKLQSAPMKEIDALAKEYNLKPRGAKGLLCVRVSVTSPINKKVYTLKFSTKTSDKRTGVIVAKPQVDSFRLSVANPNVAKVLGSKKLTVGDLEQAYYAAPTVGAKQETREDNIANLVRIIQRVHGDDFDAKAAPVTIISKQLAKQYQSLRLAYVTQLHGDNLEAIETSKRAINRTLSSARGIFSLDALEDYETLALPESVLEFARTRMIPARKANEPVQLEDAVVSQMLNAMALHKSVDLGVWVAFQLFAWAGLRNIELMHIRAGWFTKIANGYRIQLKADGKYIPKGRNTTRVIPAAVAEEILATVEAQPGEKWENAHVVPAARESQREDICYKRVQKWMKGHGVGQDAGKIAYRLRKYFFHKVQEQQGLHMANWAHGGGSIQTVMDSYTGTPKMAKGIELNFPQPPAPGEAAQ